MVIQSLSEKNILKNAIINRYASFLNNLLGKIDWSENLTPEIIPNKSEYEGVKNGRSKRIK